MDHSQIPDQSVLMGNELDLIYFQPIKYPATVCTVPQVIRQLDYSGEIQGFP
jgi:hypothetical protein